MNNVEVAKNKFIEGYNWAQSVLFAFADDRIIDKNTALKITTGFGGGVAKEGEICGAFTAGVMLLGLVQGRGLKEDETYQENTYQRVQDFIGAFKEKNNSILCREILNGYDLKTETGNKFFQENNFKDEICLHCVSSAVELLNKFI